MPAPFNKLLRVKYFPDTDVMYLGGIQSIAHTQVRNGGIVGTEIVRYDNWTKDKKLRWRILFPTIRKPTPC
jgi:uncharacterized protein YuzE